MHDSDAVFYVGVVAAAAAVDQPPARIQRLILDGFLETRRGGSTPRGGRPAHLIRRADLLEAIRRYDAWERRESRAKPAAAAANPPRRPPARRTRMTRLRRKAMRKMRREFYPSRPRPRKYDRNRLGK